MLSVFIFLIIIILKADARGPDHDPVEITFEIITNERNYITCDHKDYKKHQQKYTVPEGGNLTITTKYNNLINHLICSDYNNNGFYVENDGLKNVITVQKRMGTLWNCTVLTHRNNPIVLPVVQYNNDIYSAAYCFMKIHVRQRDSPQTILVNNMVLQAVRTDLSEKDVDFTAEYQYADGDVVNVTCINFLNPGVLTMEYAMAGTMSDNSTMAELLSNKAIGFRVKLHSGHNNGYMTCTNTGTTDYTKVMVRFVMRTEFNHINVRINGMTIRPKLRNANRNDYVIEYKYSILQLINVVCEVQRTDMELVVVDQIDFAGKISSYKKRVLIPKKKTEMSFYLSHEHERKLLCSSDYFTGGSAEQVSISFTAGNFTIDQYPLHMELLSIRTRTVMELYSDNDNKLRIILYEFQNGEILQLQCGPLPVPSGPGPALYLQFKDSYFLSRSCNEYGCHVAKSFKVTRKDYERTIVCYLKEQSDRFVHRSSHKEKVLREIRVVLRERVLTTSSTTTSTTSTTTTSPVTSLTTVITTTGTTSIPASSETSSNSYTLIYCLTAAGVSVIIILAILFLAIKRPCCCKRSSSQELPSVPAPRPNPDTAYYENLLSVFQPINEREAAELENHYEEIQ